MTGDKRIIVTYDKSKMKVEAFGMSGPQCEDKTKFLEEALGTRDGDTIRKAEWYLENSENLRYQAELGIDGSKICG